MKVLLLSSRFPWPAYTGDRLRATIWLAALAGEADVALVAPPGRLSAELAHVRLYPAARSWRRGVAGALRVAGGAPLQSLLAAPYRWDEAIERAGRDFGAFDATVVLLSRLDAVVRGQLPEGFRVLDAVDSLRRSMEERAAEGSVATRWVWRAEARRVARVEREAARAYDRVVAVSAEDAAELDAVVVSNGVRIAPLQHRPRAFDFGFWGRLAYFANRDAVDWLLGEIWPAIRARCPHATLVIGGADAPPSLRALDGRDGISVQSPVADIAAFARDVKVALFPVRYGTGQSNKVLEAAEAGCAIAATGTAMRGLDALAAVAPVADDTDGLAHAAVAAISDEPARAAMAAALRGVVETRYSRQATLDRLAALLRRREAAA